MRNRLDKAYAAAEPPADLPDLEQSLADLDRQIELLDPAYASLTTVATLTADEVQGRLPVDAALLTYVSDSNDRLWALIVTAADVHGIQIPQLSLGWLEAYLVDHFDGVRRGSLTPEPQTGYLARSRLFPDLYRALIEPVWKWLANVHTLTIIPFGPLHYVPLAALLPDLDGSPPLLMPGRRVIYAPSATVHFRDVYIQSPPRRPNVLAVAPQDARLRFTQGAAAAIARHANGVTLTGPAATRQALLDQSSQVAVLLFLGHALFDRRHPMSSGLQLADGRLQASEIVRELRLQADLVILAACESGRGQVLRGEEILGLSRALLYAGAQALLVTLWPVHEIPTRLFMERLMSQLSATVSFDPPQVVTATQLWLHVLSFADAQALLAGWDEISSNDIETYLLALWHMTHPGETPQAHDRLFAHPFFWAPYILIRQS